MVVPRKRTTKSSQKQRRHNLKLKRLNLRLCPSCKNYYLAHSMCINCGYYNEKLVMGIQKNKKKRGK